VNNKENKILKYMIVSIFSMIIGSIVTYFCSNNTFIEKRDSKFDMLYKTYDIIKNDYYKDVKDEVLVEGAINGMMSSLGDPHSVYFNKKAKEEFDTELTGSYYGIGAEIASTNDGKAVIKKVFDKSPAKTAGLKENDVFVSIDGESVEGKSISDIANTLRSEKKEKSIIVVNRDGKELSFEVTKANVTLFSVSSEMLDNNIGYISVNIFGQNTYDEFTKALNDLEKENMKSLIIDLRGNNGGYLTTVTNMLSIFLDKDKVIYQMQTKTGKKKYYSIKNGSKTYKVVILIDNESASASEIMASAMSEQYGAILVGEKSYGKGTVQITKDLKNGGMIKYTIQNWLTSKGKSIEKNGIKPDYEIKLNDEYANNPTKENDNQLQKAIDLLK
jgi:carboxyl-terminal processing protease